MSVTFLAFDFFIILTSSLLRLYSFNRVKITLSCPLSEILQKISSDGFLPEARGGGALLQRCHWVFFPQGWGQGAKKINFTACFGQAVTNIY